MNDKPTRPTRDYVMGLPPIEDEIPEGAYADEHGVIRDAVSDEPIEKET